VSRLKARIELGYGLALDMDAGKVRVAGVMAEKSPAGMGVLPQSVDGESYVRLATNGD